MTYPDQLEADANRKASEALDAKMRGDMSEWRKLFDEAVLALTLAEMFKEPVKR